MTVRLVAATVTALAAACVAPATADVPVTWRSDAAVRVTGAPRAPVEGPVAAQRYARMQLASRGQSNAYRCLHALWYMESRWEASAQNPTSTAYGIPQFLNSTWRLVHAHKSSNPRQQIDAGLAYIDLLYHGSPCAAWRHWRTHHNY